MADETRTSGEPADPPRRRRVPPPTIDLSATDVSAPAGAPASDSVPSDPPSGEPASVAPERAEPAASPASSDRPDDPPHPQTTAPESAPAAPPVPGRYWPGWPQVAAGALGAALALVCAAGLWALLGAGRDRASDRASDLSARLTRAEAQLGELARGAPDTARNDTTLPGDLAQRLGRIEAALAAPRAPQPDPALADLGRRTDDAMAASREARDRAEAAANALADVARQLAQLNAERARTPAVARADLDALAARLAGLESATKTLGDQLAKAVNAAGAGDVRHAVIAMALDAAAERGAPYGRELAALDPQIAGPAALAALAPFAQTGIPGTPALARELAALMPEALLAAEGSEPEGGFLDRLQANAERLVRIRPIAQQRGAEPSAILGRVESKTQQGDIAGALAEAGRLAPAVRAPLAPWIKRAEARNAALAASSGLAARAFDLIGRTPPQGASQR